MEPVTLGALGLVAVGAILSLSGRSKNQQQGGNELSQLPPEVLRLMHTQLVLEVEQDEQSAFDAYLGMLRGGYSGDQIVAEALQNPNLAWFLVTYKDSHTNQICSAINRNLRALKNVAGMK